MFFIFPPDQQNSQKGQNHRPQKSSILCDWAIRAQEWWLGHTTYKEATGTPYILFSPLTYSATCPPPPWGRVYQVWHLQTTFLIPLHFKRSLTDS